MSQQTAVGIVRGAIRAERLDVVMVTYDIWAACGRDGRRQLSAEAKAKGVRVNVRLGRD